MKISEDLVKNDVPAVGQLAENDCVSFCLTENADSKLLILGNSITRHGRAENLGWYGDWGMAASCAEKDYVHTLVRRLQEDGKRVSYCLANMSEWERERDESLLQTRYAAAKAFGADTVVVRLGENARLIEDFDGFCACYTRMVRYFAAERTALTDLFWEYGPFDDFVRRFAREQGYAFAALHDLGTRSDMKATGKFAHAGVAAHPSDKGMEEIANRIYAALQDTFRAQ